MMPSRIEIECEYGGERLYEALETMLEGYGCTLSMERWEHPPKEALNPRPVFEPDVVDRVEKLERALNDMGHRLNAAERALAPQR